MVEGLECCGGVVGVRLATPTYPVAAGLDASAMAMKAEMMSATSALLSQART